MFKLSIITVNYNNREGLIKTVSSVINQTWQEFEYIIIDGGSNDGSKEYLESKSQYFNYWVSEKDSGIYNAMNKGIVNSNGKYLLFLNSGDVLYNNQVLKDVNDRLSLEVSFVCGNLCYEVNNKKIIRKHPDAMSFSYLVSNTVSHPSTFIKKVMFDKYGLYNEENKIVSDWEFFFKALGLNGENYQKIDCTITNFDMTGISSSQEENVKMEKQIVLKKYLPYIFNNENDSYIFDKFRETNKRFNYLKQIDNNSFFRKIATLQLAILVKILRLLYK